MEETESERGKVSKFSQSNEKGNNTAEEVLRVMIGVPSFQILFEVFRESSGTISCRGVQLKRKERNLPS